MSNELSSIAVTRPLLPDQDEVQRKIAEIWSSQWLTNMGAQHGALESRLAEFLEMPFVSLFNNGTNALYAALRVLDLPLGGEVIVTPFTFPASVHVITACGLTPVFCDIDPVTLTLDPTCIERLITPRTCAILGVHVYGIACDVQAIDAIATRHDLKVVYDAAHAFGSRIDGIPISRFGDVTMHSFHATKLFHTVEGGGLLSPHPSLQRKIYLERNFGIANEETILSPGLNGKANEIQSAIGLLVLDMVEAEWGRRKALLDRYRPFLSAMRGVTLMEPQANVTPSYQYLPIRIDAEKAGFSRDSLYTRFRNENILARKYFYPLCSSTPHYRDLPSAQTSNLPVATKASGEVLCLPFYGALSANELARVFNTLLAAHENPDRVSVGDNSLSRRAI
ncbi:MULTISPECIES: DegT/DnrJ/EryC1/StrS family aminotransferase [unclassified Rhizobium]|uniref:DegT/DnrJ/EryC1/StrS family aminotransferase n=1 Tax=unclassified Rhizobium TaxID=2613769 RepID=UPI00380976C1